MTAENHTISVVIVNLNGRPYLPRCLGSVFAQTVASETEVILVDNRSTDGSVAFVRERFPQVRVIENAENLGFAAAFNQGARSAAGDFVLTLNADIDLEPDFMEELLHAIRQDETIGAATGKLYRMLPDGGRTDEIDCAGHHVGRDRKVVGTAGGIIPDGGEPAEVFGVPGCASLYRKAMLEDVALDGEILDEDFFAFFEDIDLDWRARRHGWRSVLVPRAVGWHVRGGTGVRSDPRVEALVQSNAWLTLLKNDRPAALVSDARPVFLRFYRECLQNFRKSPRIPFYALQRLGRLLVPMAKKRMRLRRQAPAPDIRAWLR